MKKSLKDIAAEAMDEAVKQEDPAAQGNNETEINPQYPHIPPAALDRLSLLDEDELKEAATVIEKYFSEHPDFAKYHQELMSPTLFTTESEARENEKFLKQIKAGEKAFNNLGNNRQNGAQLNSLIDDILIKNGLTDLLEKLRQDNVSWTGYWF